MDVLTVHVVGVICGLDDGLLEFVDGRLIVSARVRSIVTVEVQRHTARLHCLTRRSYTVQLIIMITIVNVMRSPQRIEVVESVLMNLQGRQSKFGGWGVGSSGGTLT